MLKRIALRRFVFIREAVVEFGRGFCAFTGETGAGKSLLVEALSLLAGARPVSGMLMPGAENFEIEAVFAADGAAADFLRENDLEGEDGEMLARGVFGGPRTRAYINGRRVPSSVLADAVSLAVDICGQHEYYSLRKPAAQRAFIDGCGGAAEAAAVRESHRQWTAAAEQLRRARESAEDARLRRESLAEEIAELNGINFSAAAWESENLLLTRLSNAEDLAAGGGEALRILEDTILSGLSRARRRLSELSRLDEKIAAPLQCIDESAAAAEEAARTLSRYADELRSDPEALAKAENFVAEAHRMARKYRLLDPALLESFISEKEKEYAALESSADAASLEKTESKLRAEFAAKCKLLTQKRRAAKNMLEKKTGAILQKLSMPEAKLHVALSPLDSPGAHGAERTELLVSTRKDAPPGALAEVASGGELSRLGLALQLAGGGTKPVAVFDEVDAGIGGAAASAAGGFLRALGESRQVLCVTHLAQVAAHADLHWRVRAVKQNGARAAEIKQLSDEERTEELARIVGGAAPGNAARANAAELLRQARKK